MGDFIEPGYLEVLTDKVKADKNLKWDDIAPFFRDFSASYKGDVYTIPLDGDFQMAYYRTDLLKEAGMAPPKTWDDYLAIAQHFNGKDLNGDGKADYGSRLAKRRQGRLRLVHRQEAQRAELLVHHLDRRQLPANRGHRPGRLLRRRHDAADRQRGIPEGAADLPRFDQVRAA